MEWGKLTLFNYTRLCGWRWMEVAERLRFNLKFAVYQIIRFTPNCTPGVKNFVKSLFELTVSGVLA